MQTNLAPFIKDTAEGREADAILRKCTHCGMCTATCPTYQLLSDELDGPRGRIYLIKEVLEGATPTAKTQLHLDRCLTCRACESTCPTGVRYGRLLDIGRHLVEERVGRSALEALKRKALRTVIPRPSLFDPLLKLGRMVRPLLPGALKSKVPASVAAAGSWPKREHSRRMLVLEGCALPSLSPNTNTAAARVLDRLGITLVRPVGAGCCGALSFHLNAQEEALDYMRCNVDAWWPHVERGVEAIVITASGCGTAIKNYGHHLSHDPTYAEKARRVSELAKDLVEVVSTEKDRLLADWHPPSGMQRNIAFQVPCSLQHGLRLSGRVEVLLGALGFQLAFVPEAHLCCGAAGTYSILQPELSQKLLANKIAALESGQPAAILTANVGCQTHLQGATKLPVRHWIEALDEILVPNAELPALTAEQVRDTLERVRR